MINLAIALGIGAALFALGWVVAGTWLAGIPPFLLAAPVAWYLLGRRTARRLEAIANRAVAEVQAGRIDAARRIFEEGFRLAPWHFLVREQIHAQLGALDYLQRRWSSARAHLEKSWSRNWMAQAMLAAIDLREKKYDAALERLERLRGAGGRDPTYWGLYAWTALEAGDRDRALLVLDDGMKKCPESEALKRMADQVRNRRKVKMKAFAPAWYQFFPEHMPRSEAMRHAAARPGYGPPMPRGRGRPR